MARTVKKRPVHASARAKPYPPTPAQEAATLRRLVEKQQKTIAELEAKLAKPVDASAVPAAPTDALAAIAKAARGLEDPLAIQDAAYRALGQTFFDAAEDVKLGPRERRKELRTISASMAKLFPPARLYKVEQLIRKDREPIESRARVAPPISPIP